MAGPRPRVLSIGWLAACLLLAGCGGASTPTAAPSPPGSEPQQASASADPTPTAAPTGPTSVGLDELAHLEVALAGGPDLPTALDGSIWILAPDGPLQGGGLGPLVYRLDATSGMEQARVSIDGRLCQGMAAAEGSLWACAGEGLARIDPATNEVVATVPFATAQVFVRPVATSGRIWMLAGNVVADQLVEIDPSVNEVVATHPLGHVATGLAAGEGALWATVQGEGLVLRIDPSSGEVSVHAQDLPAPGTIVVGAGSLWVVLHADHGGAAAAPGEPVIARLSTSDGSVEAEFDVGTPTMVEGDIWVGDDAVWVRTPADPFLVLIDPVANRVVHGVAGFHSGGSLTVVDGAIWTTSIEFSTAWRIEP